jgi:HD-like signal output (HDOD) protein
MSSENIKLTEQAQQIVASLEKQIASGAIDIPMLPEVANKALMLAHSPDSDASEMAKLIEGDQSLAAHVMRIANSVAYTPLSNLVSLQQAIARLGMGVISEIALAASIGTKMFNTPGYEDYVDQQWKHALATGLWAKEVARQSRSNVEVAFLAGLLHSMGKPAVLQLILDLARQKAMVLSKDSVMGLVDMYAHQVTTSVVSAWQMPTLVIEAVSFFNDYDNAPTSSTQAAQVNAGTNYATHMIDAELLDQETLLSLPVLAALNLYQDEAEKLLEQTEIVKERLEGLMA